MKANILISPLIAVAFSSGSLNAAEEPASTSIATASLVAQNRALVNKYCVICHNMSAKTAGLELGGANLDRIPENAQLWEKVVWKLRTGSMPPPRMPGPASASSEALATWLETKLDAAATHPNPGRTEAMHRLNRSEYQNAIRDLLAFEVDASSLLLANDASYGFDNIAGVLRISPVLMVRYASAAEKINRIAVGSLKIPPRTRSGSSLRSLRQESES